MSKARLHYRSMASAISASALAVVVSALAAPPARAEVIPASQMMRGTQVTQADCSLRRDTVWVRVGTHGFCVRYYVSTEGGEGDVPVVYLSGDKLGIYNARTRMFRPRPGQRIPDVNTADLQRRANHISRQSRTTAIYLARIGVDGTSGFHGERRSWLELYLINAALDELKKRHRFRGFHLVGQSGGGTLIGGLLAMRSDIGCAVPGAGMMAYLNRRGRAQAGPGLTQKFDPIAGIVRIVRNRPARIIVVTDPQDRTVPVEHQNAFVQALQEAGYPVEQFFVEATDERRHGVTPYSIYVVAACVRGESDEQIAQGLSRFQERVLAAARARKQAAGGGTSQPVATPHPHGRPRPPAAYPAQPRPVHQGRPAGQPQPVRYGQPLPVRLAY